MTNVTLSPWVGAVVDALTDRDRRYFEKQPGERWMVRPRYKVELLEELGAAEYARTGTKTAEYDDLWRYDVELATP
jgi:hypothetical protein